MEGRLGLPCAVCWKKGNKKERKARDRKERARRQIVKAEGGSHMTDKELKKLTRLQLLELLVEQGKELERQRARAERAEKKLRERNVLLGEAGSIAEAALRIQGVFEAAQAAADQYLDSVRGMCGIAVSKEEWREYEEQEKQKESEGMDRDRGGWENPEEINQLEWKEGDLTEAKETD
jgi:hypothetical protein